MAEQILKTEYSDVMQKSYIERFDNSKRILTKQTRYNQRGAYVR